MNLPKISIVTPSLNQGNYLEETILSVINQNYPNLEYIIIDGGSTDNSIEIINKYSSHLTYWTTEKDTGQSQAINKGLKKCTGDIVTWLNSDDSYLAGTLNKVASYYQKGNFSLLYAKSILFGQGRREQVIGFSDPPNASLRCLSYVPFPQPSTFFKRKVLLEQGYLDETLHYCMDHDLFVKIALNYEIYGVEEIFSRYRCHNKGKSNFPLKFAEERIKVFSKVLRSFDGSDRYMEILKGMGCYSDGMDVYTFSKGITEAELRRAFIYFLEVQMHYYYDALEKGRAKEIAKYLRNQNDLVINQKDASKIYLRTSLLNKRLISIFRKFTRN